MKWVEIFNTGRKTSNRGVTDEWGLSRLKQIASNYSPKKFRAPLILSHKTNGVPDDKLHASEFAYGAPDVLKVKGKKLLAGFAKVHPAAQDWTENGQVLAISPSFYPPHHPSSPYGGEWGLRHIAMLGKSPPANKGMEPPRFEEWDNLIVSFDGDCEGCVSYPTDLSSISFQELDDAEFGEGTDDGYTQDFSVWQLEQIPKLMGNIRDYLIEENGIDAANKVIPADMLTSLSQMTPTDIVTEPSISFLRKRIRALEQNAPAKSTVSVSNNYQEKQPDMKGNTTKPKASSADTDDEEQAQNQESSYGENNATGGIGGDVISAESFAEMRQQIAGLVKQNADLGAQLNLERAQLARERTELQRQQITSFVEAQVGDHRWPESFAEDLTTVLMTVPGGEKDSLDFAEGVNASPRDRMMQMISKLPRSVSAENISAPAGYTPVAPQSFNEAGEGSADLDRRIKAKMKELGHNTSPSSEDFAENYNEAWDALEAV